MILILLHCAPSINAFSSLVGHEDQTGPTGSFFFSLLFCLFLDGRLIDLNGVESRVVDKNVKVTSLLAFRCEFLSYCLPIMMEIAVVNLIKVFAEVLESHVKNAIIST